MKKEDSLLSVKKEESVADTDAPSNSSKKSVMDTVATAMDDLCLSLNADTKEKLKKLPDHMKIIKKNKKKKKGVTK